VREDSDEIIDSLGRQTAKVHGKALHMGPVKLFQCVSEVRARHNRGKTEDVGRQGVDPELGARRVVYEIVCAGITIVVKLNKQLDRVRKYEVPLMEQILYYFRRV
jgi:hypothetical protein